MKISLALAVILLVGLIGVVAAAVLFVSTFPQVTVPPAAVISNCTTLVQEGTVTPTTGTLMFDCGTSPLKSAFTVNTAGVSTPAFTLPAGYTASLGIVVSGQPCSSRLSITSGTSVTLTTPGGVSSNWDYCVDYSVASTGTTLSGFTVSWS